MKKKENKFLFAAILIIIIAVSIGVTWTTLENEYNILDGQDESYVGGKQVVGEGMIGSAKVGINITGG